MILLIVLSSILVYCLLRLMAWNMKEEDYYDRINRKR